jgi:multiple sugar transport system permease protein
VSEDPEFRGPPLRFRVREWLFAAALYGSAAVILFVGVAPLYWMAQTAFTDRATILAGVSAFPTASSFTVENFWVLSSGSVPLFLLNSALVTTGAVVGVVTISTVAGYGLSRFGFPHKENFARFLLFGYMFSPIVLGLPLFLIWRDLGLLNTRFGLSVALTAISLPFTVWLMWKYMQTIPESMEESAWIAGASRWQSFWHVILPQTKPAMIACSLFAFAIAWNDFTLAQILLPDEDRTTFAPGLLRLITQSYEVAWGELMAVSLLITLPPLVFAFFLQEYLLQGFKIRSL